MRLHNWAFDDPSVFEQWYGNLVDETGADVMGRRSPTTRSRTGRQGPAGRRAVLRRHPSVLAGADPVFRFVTERTCSLRLGRRLARSASG